MYTTCKCGKQTPHYEGHICSDCQKAARKVVAIITLAESREVSRMQESAAAYYTIRVEPGTYPVELRVTGRGQRYLASVFSGMCIASGYGSRVYREDIGNPGEVVLQPYKYQLRGNPDVAILDLDALETAQGA